MKIGVIMDPIESINVTKDSTLMMILEMQSRGMDVHFINPKNLSIKSLHSHAISQELKVDLDATVKFNLSEEKEVSLESFQAILMRQDPPFNMDYIYNTYVLDLAEKEGVLVVNSPSSLRNCNEKVFATNFPQCTTPFLVSSSLVLLKEFIAKYKDVIVKPLDGMGGVSIYRLISGDTNISVILEDITRNSSVKVMAQTYIPEISEGDKRILLVDGKPMDASIARIPAEGELRGNLAAGGRALGKPLSENDLYICEEVGPTLKKLGLVFVGIDIIGNYLTEINVTSPTCIQEYKRLCNIDVAADLIDTIEKKVNER